MNPSHLPTTAWKGQKTTTFLSAQPVHKEDVDLTLHNLGKNHASLDTVPLYRVMLRMWKELWRNGESTSWQFSLLGQSYISWHCPFIQIHAEDVERIVEEWPEYKLAVLSFGAVMHLMTLSLYTDPCWGYGKNCGGVARVQVSRSHLGWGNHASLDTVPLYRSMLRMWKELWRSGESTSWPFPPSGQSYSTHLWTRFFSSR